MGRLFWKLVVVFWIALLVAGYGVGSIVRLHDESLRNETRILVGGPRAEFAVKSATALLRHGGPDGLRELLSSEGSGPGPQLLAVDENSRELLDRPVPPQALLRARELAADSHGSGIARFAQAADGHTWLLFLPGDARSGDGPGARPPPPDHGPPVPWVPIVAGIIASLGASALLAWYLARPIRVLREAFESTAAGKLDTRVQARIGSRRDEIADLGRDFDRMATRIESLVASQRRLLHDVSHELRSPLARLQVAIGLARQNPQKQEAALDRVERESVRLDELVGELLTLSRLEAGAPDQARDRFDLAELLSTIADDARFEAQASGRDVRCIAPVALPMEGHEQSLHRALENVVRNALKYTPGGGTVEIELKAVADRAEVTVCDRGPGVSDEDLERIFEPFYRGAEPRLPGTGLGLAIAWRAVRSHGGSIRASNRSGGGLCVEVRLPA